MTSPGQSVTAIDCRHRGATRSRTPPPGGLRVGLLSHVPPPRRRRALRVVLLNPLGGGRGLHVALHARLAPGHLARAHARPLRRVEDDAAPLLLPEALARLLRPGLARLRLRGVRAGVRRWFLLIPCDHQVTRCHALPTPGALPPPIPAPASPRGHKPGAFSGESLPRSERPSGESMGCWPTDLAGRFMLCAQPLFGALVLCSWLWNYLPSSALIVVGTFHACSRQEWQQDDSISNNMCLRSPQQNQLVFAKTRCRAPVVATPDASSHNFSLTSWRVPGRGPIAGTARGSRRPRRTGARPPARRSPRRWAAGTSTPRPRTVFSRGAIRHLWDGDSNATDGIACRVGVKSGSRDEIARRATRRGEDLTVSRSDLAVSISAPDRALQGAETKRRGRVGDAIGVTAAVRSGLPTGAPGTASCAEGACCGRASALGARAASSATGAAARVASAAGVVVVTSAAAVVVTRTVARSSWVASLEGGSRRPVEETARAPVGTPGTARADLGPAGASAAGAVPDAPAAGAACAASVTAEAPGTAAMAAGAIGVTAEALTGTAATAPGALRRMPSTGSSGTLWGVASWCGKWGGCTTCRVCRAVALAAPLIAWTARGARPCLRSATMAP